MKTQRMWLIKIKEEVEEFIIHERHLDNLVPMRADGMNLLSEFRMYVANPICPANLQRPCQTETFLLALRYYKRKL